MMTQEKIITPSIEKQPIKRITKKYQELDFLLAMLDTRYPHVLSGKNGHRFLLSAKMHT